MQTPHIENIEMFKTRLQQIRAALHDGRCPKCFTPMREEQVYLSLHALEFGIQCAGMGRVWRTSIPWCPACEQQPQQSGCVHMKMYPSTEELPIVPLRCDFCQLITNNLKDYTAEQFLTARLEDGRELIDEGIWGACVRCAFLIDNELWVDLVKRGVDATLLDHPEIHDTPKNREVMMLKSWEIVRAVFGEKVNNGQNQNR
jgi:hypothetical protein